jgi:transposase-like protein
MSIDYNAAGELAMAASTAAKATRRVMVTAAHETVPTHRVLHWHGARPYILVGFRKKHREYLTGFTRLHNGALYIFTAA